MKAGAWAGIFVSLVTGVSATAAAQTGPVEQGTSGAGSAAEAKPSDGEIVVTARRRAELLRDVPASATVFDAQSLIDRGSAITNVQEILQNAPGVRFFNTSSQINSETSIRGSSTARGTNADPSVGLFRNGVYIGGGFLGGRNASTLDLFDIGRVEVLRGPQGALYGRNAVGGAVNFVSAEPALRREGFIDLNYGFETDTIRAQAVWNEPLNDRLAVRLGIDRIDRDKGFFFNPNNNVYFDRHKSTIVRGQIRYKTDTVDIRYLGEFQDAEIPSVTFRAFVRPGATPAFPLGYVQDPYRYPWNTPPRAYQDVEMHILSAEFDLGFATLNSISSYRKRKSFFQFDQDAIDPATLAQLNAQGQNRNANPNLSRADFDRTRTWYQNVYLTGKQSGPLSWLLGAEYVDQDTSYQILTGTSLVPPIPGTRTDGKLTYNSIAAYGSIGYEITSALKLDAELRYTHDEKSIDSAQFDRITGALGPSRFLLDDRFENDNVAWAATLGYKAGGNWLVFGKVGTGYRVGGFNFNLGDPRQPVPIPESYGNEDTVTYEIGAKGNLAPWLYANFAAYRTDFDNIIIGLVNGCAPGNPVCPTASVPFLTNAGTARAWGIEAEASANWTIGTLRARLTLAASRQDGKVTSGPFDGAQLPQIPEWIVSAAFNLRAPVSDRTKLFFNANYQGAWGGLNELTPPGTPLRQPSSAGPYQSPIDTISLLDLRAGVEFDNLTLALYANNALQYQYIVYELVTTQRLNPRRLIGLDARYRF
jgi:iron complex outermembrane receptor protein